MVNLRFTFTPPAHHCSSKYLHIHLLPDASFPLRPVPAPLRAPPRRRLLRLPRAPPRRRRLRLPRALPLLSSTASFTFLPPQLPAPPPSSSLAPPPLLSLSPPRAELQRRGRTGCSAQLGSGGARGRPRHPPGHGAARPSSLSPRRAAGLRELGSIPPHRALAGHGGKAVPPPRAIPLPGGRPRQDGARRGWRPPPSKRGSGPRGSLHPPSCPGPAGL